VDIPPCPPGLLASSRQAWQDYWQSKAATWVDRHSAMPRLRRWVRDVDAYERIVRELAPGVRAGLVALEPEAPPEEELEPQPHGGTLQRKRAVGVLVRDEEGVPGVFDSRRPWLGLGSTGQVTAHPHTQLLNDLDARIHRAEVEFGMTPYAAVRLAGAGVQGALTAEQLRQHLAGNSKGAQEDLDAPWAAGLRPA
jgi:hypothetical protein